MQRNNRGFTLLELLIVVLIISILAGVALPQYKHAVNRARMTQVITAAKALAAAERRYYIENNVYTSNLEELDIQYPLSDDKKEALLGKISCYMASINSAEDARVKCDVLSPRIIWQEYVGKSAFSCISYQTDNYAGDAICKQLTEVTWWYNGCGSPACHIYLKNY